MLYCRIIIKKGRSKICIRVLYHSVGLFFCFFLHFLKNFRFSVVFAKEEKNRNNYAKSASFEVTLTSKLADFGETFKIAPLVDE